ncbi:MAG: N-6 DNA methylase [Butyrivibrio sp.]|nr:N-6 DNA methylase [Butyrivibrio sp.]
MNSNDNSTIKELNKDFYSLEELCDILGISPATGKNWLRLGKISYSRKASGKSFFDADYVNSLSLSIKNGDRKVLRNRRNKKYISGNNIYSSYIDSSSPNSDIPVYLMDIYDNIKDKYADKELTLYSYISFIVRHYAGEILELSGTSEPIKEILLSDLKKFLEKNKYPDKDTLWQNNLHALGLGLPDITYDCRQDTLGYIYISLESLRKRKSSGAYYTPNHIVKKLIESIGIKKGNILDPGCGCGNFLLQLPDTISFKNIYGYDINPIAIAITRINLSARYKAETVDDLDILYKNISVKNYLTARIKAGKFDYIIGNPPWGYAFSKKQIEGLKSVYHCCKTNSCESFDLFMEKSIKLISPKGSVCFVLPEAILGVKSHKPIRSYILQNGHISFLSYLGDVFDGVQCPSIIIKIDKKASDKIRVENEKESFDISSKRNLSADNLHILCNDNDFEILNNINNLEDRIYLKSNADFALGIVSGDNGDLIFDKPLKGSEPILRGNCITPFKCGKAREYTYYIPENFQQIAPEKMYHNNEKLLYRFISKYPVVARDTKGQLSLNSCNIIIPRFKDISPEYIMAVLNSSVVRFYYTHTFKTVKILRSHLESIPIPQPGESHEEIKTLVHKLESCNSNKEFDTLYSLLDNKIASLYKIKIPM